jgi:asparagine synthase (glutamine-hydrolysing)
MDHYLPSQLLRDTDVMSMAHALEVRVPLLDDLVVAAVRARADAPVSKRLLAASVDPDLMSIAATTKQTFTLPVSEWLRGPLHEWAGDMLQTLAEAGLGFDRDRLFVLFRDFDSGLLGWRAMWSLCVLGGWMFRHQSARSTPVRAR